jgi:hypothetical protein
LAGHAYIAMPPIAKFGTDERREPRAAGARPKGGLSTREHVYTFECMMV